MSATWPPEVHTFWPLTIHTSPSRDRPRREAGEVGSRARLAEQLAPAQPAAHRVGDVPLDLLTGPVGDDRRRDEPDAHARRARRARRTPRSSAATRMRVAAVEPAAVAVDRQQRRGPARTCPSRSHHSPTVRSGSQLSASQPRSSATRSVTWCSATTGTSPATGACRSCRCRRGAERRRTSISRGHLKCARRSRQSARRSLPSASDGSTPARTRRRRAPLRPTPRRAHRWPPRRRPRGARAGRRRSRPDRC